MGLDVPNPDRQLVSVKAESLIKTSRPYSADKSVRLQGKSSGILVMTDHHLYRFRNVLDYHMHMI